MKIRGVKRKTAQMVRRIEEETDSFPVDFYQDYWHLHMPVAEAFIDSAATPLRVRKQLIQLLIDRTVHLIAQKPPDTDLFKVVALVSLPRLFDSQLIVFQGRKHLDGFFDRDTEWQRWIPLGLERDLRKEWGITVPKGLGIIGFKEILVEENGEMYERELWFVGELNEPK